MPQTLFERYGGFATVRKIVSEFYDRVLESPDLQPYFAGTDMRKLIDHQTQFISHLMGGPASYTDDQLYRVHASLAIRKTDFNEAADILQETLEDMDVENGDVGAIVKAFRAKEPLIVGSQA